MDDLKEFAKGQLIPAQKIVRAGRELMPVLIMDTPEGTGVVGVPNYGDPQMKAPARLMMRELLRDKDATRYAFIMEAWMGSPPKDKVPPGYLPSKDPERKEAIIVTAADNTGGKITVISFITRGKEPSFSEPEFLDIGSGALLELLDQPTVH